MTDASWRTICELVDDAARRFPDLEALVDGDVRWSFSELRDHLRASARALIASGIEPGDRVAVWAPNIWEWVVAGLGTHLAGGVLVPVNTRFKGREADFILRKSGARILFCVTDFLDTDFVALLRGADGGESLDEVVVLRGAVPEGACGFAQFLDRAAGVSEADGDARAASVTGSDLCHIMFTSGTTGLPKGAKLVHSAVCRAFQSWCEVIGLRAGDRYLIVNPYFHAFGLNSGILACLMTGAANIPHAVFDVSSVMARVPEERITMLPGPPAIYQTILNHPDLDRFDMSTLRLAVTGAAAIPVEMILQMRARLGFETIVTGYGLTEASGIATMCRHDDDPETIANTSGRAIPDVEVRIVDDDGDEQPRGTPGEVVVRGYNVMVGYLDDPAQTAEAIDSDGWLHTGDIGVMDEGGNIDITDRKKDMFIVGGFNAYPAEIENIMLAHPRIGQVAVVGVPDDRLGEVAVATVVPAAAPEPDAGESSAGASAGGEPGAPNPIDAELTEESVIAWCRDQMANYKVPRRVRFTDALPLNASGKVLKYVLREQAASE